MIGDVDYDRATSHGKGRWRYPESKETKVIMDISNCNNGQYSLVIIPDLNDSRF